MLKPPVPVNVGGLWTSERASEQLFLPMRITVFFDNFGPYHVARLSAASQICEILGLEWRGRSKTYAWEPVDCASCFEKRTLLGSEVARCNNHDLLQLLENELDPTSVNAVVVNGWGDFGPPAVISWALKCGIPIVIMSESMERDAVRVGWKEWVKRNLVGLCSAALVGGSPHKEYMIKLGMPAERVFLGYDAVDNDYFGQGAKEVKSRKDEVRRKHGLPGNYFLASARFVEQKNLPRLIEAYSLYRKKAESRKRKAEIWDLVLLGDGALRESLCALRSALGLDACVHLPGFKQYPELPAYYGLANAFIHASTKEPWGLVVNEAMASGLPVLVSNRCGCAPDLVKDGTNGFTFDPYNVEEMAQLMLKISAFNFPLSAFGSESQRIISNWGTERFAAGLKAAADKAVEIGPQSASWMARLLLRTLLFR